MKAMVTEKFGGPENFRWKDWPDPEVKPGEVLIRIRAISVNPVDYKMRSGHLPIPLPDVLGRDVAGTVETVGKGVAGFDSGDEVFAVLFGPRSNGAYAQYVSTPAPFVCRKPKGLSFQQAACLGVAGMTAYDAVVNKAKIQSGETVLVAGGAGGVGSFAIPLMYYGGAAAIIATAGSQESYDHLVNALGIVSIVEEPPEFDLNIWRADISPFFAKSGTYHFVALSARARNGSKPGLERLPPHYEQSCLPG